MGVFDIFKGGADMEEICKFLGKNFDEEKFNAEFFG